MPENKQFELAANISLTDVDDEIVLLDLNTGHYFGLNRVGADMLRDLIDGKTMQQASSSIAQAHNMDAASVLNDLQQLVTELTDNGLLIEQAA